MKRNFLIELRVIVNEIEAALNAKYAIIIWWIIICAHNNRPEKRSMNKLKTNEKLITQLFYGFLNILIKEKQTTDFSASIRMTWEHSCDFVSKIVHSKQMA